MSVLFELAKISWKSSEKSLEISDQKWPFLVQFGLNLAIFDYKIEFPTQNPTQNFEFFEFFDSKFWVFQVFSELFVFASFGNSRFPKFPKITKKWCSTCTSEIAKNSSPLETGLEILSSSLECRALVLATLHSCWNKVNLLQEGN